MTRDPEMLVKLLGFDHIEDLNLVRHLMPAPPVRKITPADDRPRDGSNTAGPQSRWEAF